VNFTLGTTVTDAEVTSAGFPARVLAMFEAAVPLVIELNRVLAEDA
jgi:hypothetical protein